MIVCLARSMVYPAMPVDDRFRTFCQDRLGSAALDTTTGCASVAQFELSLASFRHHIEWSSGLVRRDGDRFHLSSGFIEDARPSAIADYWEGTHFAGMHSPLFVVVMEFAMFCFTQRNFMPWIGDASVELSPTLDGHHVPGFWLLKRTTDGAEVNPGHGQDLVSQDPVRYQASLFLGLLMARFCWLHEFSHCLNGHVTLAQDRGLIGGLNEVPMGIAGFANRQDATDKSLETELRQTLELDADMNAFFAMCQLQQHDLENIEGIRAWSKEARLVMVIFASYAMTWIFEELQLYLSSTDSTSYPKPHHRLQNLFRTAASQVRPSVARISDLNLEACNQFDTLGDAVRGMYATKTLFRDLRNDALQEEITRSDDRLSALKADLEDHAYNQPAAP